MLAIDKLTCHGRTFFLRRDISVKSKGGDTAAVATALRRARLGSMIGVSWPSFKAWCRERMFNETMGDWEANLNKLPPSIRAVVDVIEFHTFQSRKA